MGIPPEHFERVIVAPHMDDESLGCGGLLAKFPQDSAVVTLAAGTPERVREYTAAMATLGVSESVNLDFPDGQLTAYMSELVTALDELFSRWKPSSVYLPAPALHQDHIAAYEAGMRACRISMSPQHWFVPDVFVYDIAVYDLNLYPTDLRWNVFERLTEEQVDKKEKACLSYSSENPAPGGAHPMNSVREMARALGHIRLTDFAEQFALIRTVR